MCGIVLIAGLGPAAPSGAGAEHQVARQRPDVTDFKAALSARGPDHIGQLEASWLAADSILLRLQLMASLLQLRGSSTSSSPLTDAQGNILCFNGELFGGLEVPQGHNDGQCLLEALAGCNCVDEVVVLMSRLRGPRAFVYWQAAACTLWFGRDVIGRRSLLLHVPDAADPRLLLSSVSPSSGLEPRHAPTPNANAAASATSADDAGAGVARARATAQTADKEAAPAAASCSGIAAADATLALQAGGDYWAELPPGVYSITASDLAGSLANCCYGGLWDRVQRHAWQDPMLQRLQQYSRDEALLAAPQWPALSQLKHQPQKQQAHKHQQQKQSQQQQQLQDQEQPSMEQQQLQQQQRALEAGGALVLEALRQAVRTRCGCIEGHSGIASTAGTHASNAASRRPITPPKQPVAQPALQQEATADTSTLSPAPVLVLFSGGVDSMLLAALAHEALPPGVPLELANVCFDGGQSPDRLAARAGLEELARFGPDREWRLIEVNAALSDMDAHSAALLQLLRPAGTVMDLNIGTALWLAARAEGELRLPSCAQSQNGNCADDGMALANGSSTSCSGQVANGQIANGHASVDDGKYSPSSGPDCVDECMQHSDSCEVGSACTQEQQQRQQLTAQNRLPQTKRHKYKQHQQQPRQASQPQPPNMQPQLHSQPPQQHTQLHRSAARVVLRGHGADEQCGGYGRHRTSFRVASWQGLGCEMELDVKRLWLRNLGRDDRLVADHGREARHPFLDEGVLEVVLGLPLSLVADLRDPPGVGDKRLLREALRQLGLYEAAVREKRAIQFGSRIGKLSNIRHFGSGQAANKRNAGSIAFVSLSSAPGTAAKVQLKHAAPALPNHATSPQLAAALTLA